MHTSSEEWISVFQHELNTVESHERGGIKLQFMLSPADLPTAWRAYPVEQNTFAVEFKYLSGNEAKYFESLDDGVTLEVGKNSKRVYRIVLDLLRIPSPGEIMINRAAGALEQSHSLNKRNSDVIHKFLVSKKSRPDLIERIEA